MNIQFMEKALELAKEAAKQGEVPVGCVIVRDGEIIGLGKNERNKKQETSSHAEMEAIAMANRTLGSWNLDGCEIYVTLEPCPMCAGAIINARISHLYYGAKESLMGSCGSILNLFLENYPNKVKITGGIMEEESKNLLEEFFQSLRKNKN